jgi:hypothetical protein
MYKTITALGAAALVASVAVTAPTPAEARHGGAIAAGVIGGLALGALATGAYGGYWGPGYYGYGYRPAYYGAYAYGGDCFIRRQRVWTDWGWVIRRVRVCY